jgi:hypothetical protein
MVKQRKGIKVRIHTSVLSGVDLEIAARRANVFFTRSTKHGSRKRDYAYDVILSGNSPFNQNGGNAKAATWDQWGIFLAELYKRDPDMITNAYPDVDTFHYATAHRFHYLTIEHQHIRHKWENCGPYHSACECGAENYWDWKYNK